MQTSEKIDLLIAALAGARPYYKEIVKNRSVMVKTDRGAYEFSYADLGGILDAVGLALSQEGVVPVFGTEYGPTGEMWVLTRLYHISGQWIETSLNLGRAERTQDIGARMTYGKRYGIQALLAVQADDDMDAAPEMSMPKPKTTKSPKVSSPIPPASPTPQELIPSPHGGTKSPTASQSAGEERSALLWQIVATMKDLQREELKRSGRKTNVAELQELCFGSRAWTYIHEFSPLEILHEGYARLQAMLAEVQHPDAQREATDDADVPMGNLPTDAHAAAADGLPGRSDTPPSDEAWDDHLVALGPLAEQAAALPIYHAILLHADRIGLSLDAYEQAHTYLSQVAQLRADAAKIDLKVQADIDESLARYHDQGQQIPASELTMMRKGLDRRMPKGATSG